jgi:hypothetical protein
VIHCGFIAATKALSIVSLGAWRSVRMTVLIAIVDVWPAVVVVILASALDTIVISLTLDFAELLWWGIPTAVSVMVVILDGGNWRCERLSDGKAGRCESKSEGWDSELFMHHCVVPPCVPRKKNRYSSTDNSDDLIPFHVV